MSTFKGKVDLGAVMTAIISPTRIILVKDGRPNALWKLPGGTIEQKDAGIIAAAIREVDEETGVKLLPEEIMLCSNHRRAKDGKYYPYLCLAQVTEEKLESRLKVADENGLPIQTGMFSRNEVPTMIDLLDRHRDFVKALEEVSALISK